MNSTKLVDSIRQSLIDSVSSIEYSSNYNYPDGIITYDVTLYNSTNNVIARGKIPAEEFESILEGATISNTNESINGFSPEPIEGENQQWQEEQNQTNI